MPDNTFFYVSYAALWLIVAFQTIVLLEVVRRLATGQIANEAVPPGSADLLRTGTPAPLFEALDLRTKAVVRSEVLQGKPAILVFVAPGCQACHLVSDEITGFGRDPGVQVAAICHGTSSECYEFAEEYLSTIPVLLDEAGSITDQFHVSGTPTAVMLDKKGRVLRYGVPQSAVRLGLVDWLKRDGEHPDGSREAAN